jgi:Flp pilus assembly pilin Flp
MHRETRAAVATEYTFLIAFIAIVSALGMVLLGTELNEYFAKLGNAIGESAKQS